MQLWFIFFLPTSLFTCRRRSARSCKEWSSNQATWSDWNNRVVHISSLSKNLVELADHSLKCYCWWPLCRNPVGCCHETRLHVLPRSRNESRSCGFFSSAPPARPRAILVFKLGITMCQFHRDKIKPDCLKECTQHCLNSIKYQCLASYICTKKLSLLCARCRVLKSWFNARVLIINQPVWFRETSPFGSKW